VAEDFVRPGHIFPLRSRPRGVLERPGHTEAAVDLARLARLEPAGVLCEVVTPDRSGMARGAQLDALAEAHGLHKVSIAELVTHRLRAERQVRKIAEAPVPTRHGTFICQAWRSVADGVDHLALVHGDVSGGEPVLVRVHSECVTGDVFGSRRCDCGTQLDDAIEAIADAGRGVVVYLRGHEGRGIGLMHKLAAYHLQDGGRDTVDANLDLGLPADARDFSVGAQVLADLGVSTVRLLTNNPQKTVGLEAHGVRVTSQVPLAVSVTPENLDYLRTKRDRMGHLIPDLPELPDLPGVPDPPDLDPPTALVHEGRTT
jgi:3,4-dihydroxy 2-butanone 4-phosphate synthase/GTP cyclohydrolase II